MCFDVDKHSGRRAREDRWDILFRLTRCWKKLPLFSERLASISPLPPGGKQLRISGTVVLLWHRLNLLLCLKQHSMTSQSPLIGRQLLRLYSRRVWHRWGNTLGFLPRDRWDWFVSTFPSCSLRESKRACFPKWWTIPLENRSGHYGDSRATVRRGCSAASNRPRFCQNSPQTKIQSSKRGSLLPFLSFRYSSPSSSSSSSSFHKHMYLHYSYIICKA